MAFDGLITRAIISELNYILIDSKINKVYQPNNNEIILSIYNKEKFLLDICTDSSNCRINLTKYSKENPKNAPNFCMILRKYLTGSKIKKIYTYGLDRIVIIELETYNELNDITTYKLIIELMGKHSNIVLLNENNIILDSIRHIYSSNALRTIAPAAPYEFPISEKLSLLNVTEENFVDSILTSNNNLTNSCSTLFTGISKSFMTFSLATLDIPNVDFKIEDLVRLYRYIQNILSCKNVICKNFTLNNKKEFSITNENIKSISINEFIDDFYHNKENADLFINYRNAILKLILSMLNKYNKKLNNIQEKLEQCKDMEKYRLYGELITANLYRINNNTNLSSIDIENYYDNNNIISIPLEKEFSPSLNAKRFFKKYNKLKTTLDVVSKQKIQIISDISYLESIVYSLEKSKTINEINEIYQEISENVLKQPISKLKNKQRNKPINITPIEIDGYKVYVGKNNKQNDIIAFKLSDKSDLWFHVQGFHGSHVVLKTDNKEILDNDEILIKCAKLAAINSKANSDNKVLVDYTLIKNIKKPNGAKPGFVIFNNYNSIMVSLD